MFIPKPLAFRGEMSCTNCKLCTVRQRVVTGYGNPLARAMIVSEKPGPDENISQRPFTGPSGQLLRNYMRTAKLNLDFHFYTTNVVKCITPGGKRPGVKEINSCKPWLEQEIRFVDPDVLIAMGDVAMDYLLPGETKKITQVQGNVYKREIVGRERLVIPTIHPAFVARNPQALAPGFMNDLRKIREVMLDGWTATTTFRVQPGTWDEVLATITHPIVGLDFETGPAIDTIATRIIGIGVCSTPEDGIYYAFKSDSDMMAKLHSIRDFFEGPTVKVISNAVFEMEVLANIGIGLNNYEDTMLEAWVMGDFPLSLKDGMHRAFGIEMIRIDKFHKLGYVSYDPHTVSKASPNGKRIVDMAKAQDSVPDAVAEYASQDPDSSLRLHGYLMPILHNRQLKRLYEEIELPFVRVLADIERTGFRMDPSRLTDFATAIDTAEVALTEQIETLARHPINVASPKQVIHALYHDRSHPYTIPEVDDEDAPTPTDKTSLAWHGDNLLVTAILSLRAVRKMRGTYVEALPRWLLPDGRIYPRFHQSAAETGRMSSTRPNITNQPSRKRDDISVELDGGLIRLAYIPREGCAIVAADISQIEKRISAHLSQDEAMLYFLSDPSRDIHGNTTTQMYGITKEATDPREWKNKRDMAKMIGFGIDYGLSDVGLVLRAPKAGLSVAEANALIQGYYAAYPGVREWQLRTKRETFRRGYAETMMGRRRYLPDITSKSGERRSNAARQSINHPIQGSAADYFKTATLRVWEFLHSANLKTKIVALVHDEIVMEAPFEEIDILHENVPYLMANAIPLSLPVFVDFEVGPSWGEVKGYEEWRSSHSNTS